MQAHAHDLRAEVAKAMSFETQEEGDAFVHSIVRDWRHAPLEPEDRALCAFAAKVTHDQQTMSATDLGVLRQHGFDDIAIHDATQVIAYFNYITRIADALGVENERFIQPWGERTTR